MSSRSSSDADPVPDAARQEQFLSVITRDEATRRFQEHLALVPLGCESVPLGEALDRVLSGDIVSQVDVPGFDRSNVDGFAVQASDTYRASEHAPRFVTLNAEVLAPGVVAAEPVTQGTATTIATGAIVPRGADAIVMVEHTQLVEDADNPGACRLEIRRAVAAGSHVTFAGTDVARGETVLRAGQLLTSREIGVLAAVGLAEVPVYRQPRLAILSTGDEIIAPGESARTGTVFDSNAAIIASTVQELGCLPVMLGIVGDDEAALTRALARALECDAVVLSGGTSKGAGDLSYHVVARLDDPGIVAHGVALKPGKPICLAVTAGKPVVILPGFPTSAIFTFHEFVAPVLSAMAGRHAPKRETVEARLPIPVRSDPGRTEYLLVGLVGTADGLAAYPIGKGSGSVTTFSHADGFLTIERHTELIERDTKVSVQLLGKHIAPADLVIIGSHCSGLDFLVSELSRRGVTVKLLNVGSQGGLAAATRGECDVAGIHLLDEATQQYNRPFLDDSLELLTGYRRMQGIVYRKGDARFENRTIEEAVLAALDDPKCTMINRNAGSGTRILIDELLSGAQPPGYLVQAKSHNAVVAAVQQQRADWGLAIDVVARGTGLSFLPFREECYDFAVPRERLERPEVVVFRELLNEPAIRTALNKLGFHLE